MGTSPVFYIIIAYMIYIVGLTLPSIIGIFKDRWLELSSPKYKLLRNKNFKVNLFIKNIKLISKKPVDQLSRACFITGLGSILFSVGIMFFNAHEPYTISTIYYICLSLFVGLWAPTLILLSLYFKK
jgi:hypothetical protein